MREQFLLSHLRALMPDHDLDLAQLFDLIDRLAAAVRLDAPVDTDQVPDEVAMRICRFRLEDMNLPAAGLCYWDPHERVWVIARNQYDSPEARRFTLWHELGHITWHGWHDRLFPGLSLSELNLLSEYAADHFAGEVLVPRRLVEQVFSGGMQDSAALAKRFEVSEDTMRWKLAQTDLPFVSSEDQKTTTYPNSHVSARPAASAGSASRSPKGGLS